MTDVHIDEAPPKSRWYSSLFVQLLVAIVAGIAIGWLWPGFGADLKPLADGFIKLIKMLIAPIIFCTVVVGIAHVGDLKSVGRIGVKALIYFEVGCEPVAIRGVHQGRAVPRAGHGVDRGGAAAHHGKLMNAGCSRTTTGLVVPTGYSFNLDGATLYLSICVLFLAQALGVDLSLGEQITAVLVLMLTSKGMAGVPGSSFLALSATVAAIGHGAIPVAAVALLLGADRIMDSMRVSVNLPGNCVATLVVVARWEGQLDAGRMRKVLRGEEVEPLDQEERADDRKEPVASAS